MTSRRIIRDRVLWVKLLKAKRLEMRISQREVSRLSNLPQQAISDWENFIYLPSHNRLERYERFLRKCSRGEIEYRTSPLNRLLQYEK